MWELLLVSIRLVLHELFIPAMSFNTFYDIKCWQKVYPYSDSNNQSFWPYILYSQYSKIKINNRIFKIYRYINFDRATSTLYCVLLLLLWLLMFFGVPLYSTFLWMKCQLQRKERDAILTLYLKRDWI